jgi:hypothetical protein
VLVSHACFLIKLGTHREEAVREVADSLLIQLRDRFPQVSVLSAGSFGWQYISIVVDWQVLKPSSADLEVLLACLFHTP